MAAHSTPCVPAKPIFDAVGCQQIAVLSELIIPITDTPGAIAAVVPDFVEMMGGRHTDRERIIFFQGLQDLDAWCHRVFEVGFQQAAEAQRIEPRQEHRFFRMTPEFDGYYDLARVDGRQWTF